MIFGIKMRTRITRQASKRYWAADFFLRNFDLGNLAFAYIQMKKWRSKSEECEIYKDIIPDDPYAKIKDKKIADARNPASVQPEPSKLDQAVPDKPAVGTKSDLLYTYPLHLSKHPGGKKQESKEEKPNDEALFVHWVELNSLMAPRSELTDTLEMTERLQLVGFAMLYAGICPAATPIVVAYFFLDPILMTYCEQFLL